MRRLQRATGALSTQALNRAEKEMPWFAQLSAQDRSWVGLIVQAGVKAFVDWYRDPTASDALRAEVFGAAPQAMAGVISLQQTVALIRLSIEVVEENLEEVVGEKDAPAVLQAVAGYAREVAFATAEVYARAAEQRGAWDARLEALVVDAVLRGDEDDQIASRATALGWHEVGNVVAVVGSLPGASAIEDVRRIAHDLHWDCLCAVQDERLVVVLGGVSVPPKLPARMVSAFAPGPVVVGPVVNSLSDAGLSASAAVSGLRAAPGWRGAPRPVAAEELLPERALAGDELARTQLVDEVFSPLLASGTVALETLETYFAQAGSTEATARALFVHANTVRYRLKGITDATGLNPATARDAYTLRIALTLGRLGQPL